MDLEQQPPRRRAVEDVGRVGRREARVDVEHRLLDQVGGRALAHRVRRLPPRLPLLGVVPRPDAVEVPLAAADRRHEAVDGAAGRHALGPPLDGGEGGVPVFDHRLRVVELDRELLDELPRPRAVEDRVRRRLGAAALLGRDGGGGRQRKEAAGDRLEEVGRAVLQGADQVGVLREVGEQPHLHLAVVGGEEDASLARHEGVAQLDRHAPLGCEHDGARRRPQLRRSARGRAHAPHAVARHDHRAAAAATVAAEEAHAELAHRARVLGRVAEAAASPLVGQGDGGARRVVRVGGDAALQLLEAGRRHRRARGELDEDRRAALRLDGDERRAQLGVQRLGEAVRRDRKELERLGQRLQVGLARLQPPRLRVRVQDPRVHGMRPRRRRGRRGRRRRVQVDRAAAAVGGALRGGAV